MDRSIYKRPNKPLTCKTPDFNIEAPIVDITQPKLISVDSSTECHTTPDNVAARMVDYLELSEATLNKTASNILEPHGGTGQLIQALINKGVLGGHINTVELNYSLCEFMEKRFKETFVNINQGSIFDECFDVFIEEYERIICNPPFKNIIRHLDRVYSFLNAGGIAICLVPITYDKINHLILEELPSDTFSFCKVNTKIIKIEK